MSTKLYPTWTPTLPGGVQRPAYDLPYSMLLTSTVSTEAAGDALGLRPAAVRLRIKSGGLTAAMIGRRWRVGISSINLLLSGAEIARPISTCRQLKAENKNDLPSPLAPEVQPEPISPFSPIDLSQINRFRLELSHPDHEVRAAARFQLAMFQERLDEQAAWKDRPAPLPVPSPEVMANLF